MSSSRRGYSGKGDIGESWGKSLPTRTELFKSGEGSSGTSAAFARETGVKLGVQDILPQREDLKEDPDSEVQGEEGHRLSTAGEGN